jgi:hypothetical protein
MAESDSSEEEQEPSGVPRSAATVSAILKENKETLETLTAQLTEAVVARHISAKEKKALLAEAKREGEQRLRLGSARGAGPSRTKQPAAKQQGGKVPWPCTGRAGVLVSQTFADLQTGTDAVRTAFHNNTLFPGVNSKEMATERANRPGGSGNGRGKHWEFKDGQACRYASVTTLIQHDTPLIRLRYASDMPPIRL